MITMWEVVLAIIIGKFLYDFANALGVAIFKGVTGVE